MPSRTPGRHMRMGFHASQSRCRDSLDAPTSERACVQLCPLSYPV